MGCTGAGCEYVPCGRRGELLELLSSGLRRSPLALAVETIVAMDIRLGCGGSEVCQANRGTWMVCVSVVRTVRQSKRTVAPACAECEARHCIAMLSSAVTFVPNAPCGQDVAL